MNIADFELLVCRTAGIQAETLDRAALERIVRSRQAAHRYRTLYEYADFVEVSRTELPALIETVRKEAIRARLPSPETVQTPSTTGSSGKKKTVRKSPPRKPATKAPVRTRKLPVPSAQQEPASDLTPARKLLAEHLASTATPDTRTLILMGLVREKEGKLEDALACYRLAELRSPRSAHAWRALLTVLIAGTDAARLPSQEEAPRLRA